MILCWGEQHSSAIHDHADSHCFMKMLKGQLTEIRYAWPKDDKSLDVTPDADIAAFDGKGDAYNGAKIDEIGRSTMETNGVCYINDNLGLHRVENPSHTEAAVSLHLYCPPYEECSIFNEKTGRRTKCQVTFWSINGQKQSKVRVTSLPTREFISKLVPSNTAGRTHKDAIFFISTLSIAVDSFYILF